jgi:hypothetical protein
MSDLVTVALIAALPATLAAGLGIFNRFTLREVKTNVDGNLMEVKNQLAIIAAQYLETVKLLAALEEKERGRKAGDAKFEEGVQAQLASEAIYARGVEDERQRIRKDGGSE